MKDMLTKTAEPGSLPAILEGGPTSIPAELRTQEVGPLEEKIKLLHWGGYEHFERAGDLVDDTSSRQILFRWTMRTEIAE
jgi:hypothetical protein